VPAADESGSMAAFRSRCDANYLQQVVRQTEHFQFENPLYLSGIKYFSCNYAPFRRTLKVTKMT